MSRGLGKVQRTVLAVLEAHGRGRWVAVGYIHGAMCWNATDPSSNTYAVSLSVRRPKPTAAQRESIRRAIHGLRQAGLVETGHGPGVAYAEGFSVKSMLHARVGNEDDRIARDTPTLEQFLRRLEYRRRLERALGIGR